MNQQRTPAKRMSYREWKIRKCLRLARNWVLFLAACGGAVALMATGILWLLPKAHALIAGPVPFAARAYSADGYVCDTDDARLVVVNANLPLESEPAPELAVADDATGEQLETEAAAAYRSMAEAAQAAGVELNLVTGWQDADTRTAAYEARLTAYQTENSRLTGETAAAHTASLQPTASTSEQGTGYCADILSPDCTERSEAFAETRAYEWLTAYAADYGFILRWPEERQSATGIGLCTVALAVCGGRERPRHPRKRPFLGRIPRAGTRKTINLQKIEGETIETNRDRARRPSAVGPGA